MADLIAIPLKKPSDVDVIKPLTNVIKSTCNSSSNRKDYTAAIKDFSKLRVTALWRAFEKYESSLEVIYSYYDQLCALESKIPSHELQIPFKWKDAFDRTIFGGKLSLRDGIRLFRAIRYIMYGNHNLGRMVWEKIVDHVVQNLIDFSVLSGVSNGKNYASAESMPCLGPNLFLIYHVSEAAAISTLAYERLCVLFVIAALQSAVASIQSLESDEGLRLAAKLFQQSAGIFNYLKCNVMLGIQQEPTPDMSPETLGALSSLMLAQAQEIFVYKAIHDSMKEGIVSKLAAQAEELYAETLKQFQKEIFRSFWDKEWVPLIAGKQAGFRAMAELYQGMVCKSNKLIGEQISRLEHAVELFKAAQQRSNKASLFQEYANRAQRVLHEVKKDNDFIYHERIPDYKNLEPVGKANVAKLIPPAYPMSSNFQDLFEDLLPVTVHHALSSYEGRKNELVNTEISKLREMTQLLNSVLASLNLPAAIEDTSGTELPQSLLEKAAQVRIAGGISALETAMNELPDLLQRNKDILDESERMLQEERDSDNQLREQFKERWTRIPSIELTAQFTVNAQKYRDIINNAVAADKIVREKFQSHRQGMEILSMDEEQLNSAVPTGSALQESQAVLKLRQLMENVETLKAERDVIESELKAATVDMKTIFLSALANDGAIDEPNLSVENIGQCYGSLTSQVRDSLVRQETLIKDIQDAHAAFTREQTGSGSSRESMLCKLAAAYDSFKELKNNLQEGAKFYNDLTQLLVVFQNKISDFCFARKTEKEELMKDLTTNLSHTGPAQTPNIPAHHGGPSGVSQSNESAPQLPYPTTYQGGMPVPYGATPAAPYPTYVPPPMPTTYNPYATMPYPSQGQQYNYPYPGTQQPQYNPFATLPRYPGQDPSSNKSFF